MREAKFTTTAKIRAIFAVMPDQTADPKQKYDAVSSAQTSAVAQDASSMAFAYEFIFTVDGQ